MIKPNHQPLLSSKVLISSPVVLFGFFIIANLLLRQLRFRYEFIMNQYWPISIIVPKLPAWPDSCTVLSIICFSFVLWYGFKHKLSFYKQIFVVWLIVLATNLLQGIEWGYRSPSSINRDYEITYWQDAKTIHDPANFLRHYTLIQPNLGYHSRVHPPLPAFIYYYLQRIHQSPIFASIILSTFSMATVWFFYHWIRSHVSETNAQFVSLLLGLSPAFQIFSLASIDIVICTMFTATLWAYDQKKESSTNLWLSITFLSLSALLTFGAIWLVPVLGVISLVRHRNLRSFFQTIIGTVAVLFFFYLFSGYSYLDGFLIAKRFEHSSLFSFSLTGMLSYVSTRIEDIAEPILFLGPYLSLYLWRALTVWIKNLSIRNKTIPEISLYVSKRFMSLPIIHFGIISLAGMCSFLGFIAFGAYYTGETSRAALYIIPPILSVIGPYFDSKKITRNEQKVLFCLVLTQTILMQLFFDFSW